MEVWIGEVAQGSVTAADGEPKKNDPPFPFGRSSFSITTARSGSPENITYSGLNV